MSISLELLSPARDLETALAAIAHGADAVYIGAPAFGARSAVPVSIADIATLTRKAHFYDTRVFVALNTILFDEEIQEARRIVCRLYSIGVDAIIIQDRGLLMCDLPPIALHASTQCDNRTAEDVLELQNVGFERVVLARELSLRQIREIATATKVELEAFVHGALCVSYSGACYLSAETTDRSANRGACSQPCRLPYNLIDSSGEVICQARYLLSLKDMNRADSLRDMADAGVCSFKIEGRLKRLSYVKNVTAYYHQRLDELVARSEGKYIRASRGETSIDFVPDVERTFNRGYTDYLLKGSPKGMASPLTPKSFGRYVGRIVRVKADANSTGLELLIDRAHQLANGDGLLIVSPDKRVGGTRCNVADGDRSLRTNDGANIEVGSEVYCNSDNLFEQQMTNDTARRLIPVELTLRKISRGFALDIVSQDCLSQASSAITATHELAKKSQVDRIETELAKLGATDLLARKINITGCEELFIPASILSKLRRQAVQAFYRSCSLAYRKRTKRKPNNTHEGITSSAEQVERPLRYSANVANSYACRHYEQLGYVVKDSAFELKPNCEQPLMTTKHCIRRELGYCTRLTNEHPPFTEPLYLEPLPKGSSRAIVSSARLRLSFDCKLCQMLVFKAD